MYENDMMNKEEAKRLTVLQNIEKQVLVTA